MNINEVGVYTSSMFVELFAGDVVHSEQVDAE